MFPSPVFQISAQDMADQLTGVNNVSTFGFSLAGQVDVDANGYNGWSLFTICVAVCIYVHVQQACKEWMFNIF